jgi:hypothetical protein
MLRGNLSTRPFYNDRAITLLVAGVTLIAALVTVYNTTRLIDLTRRRSAVHQRIASSDAQTRQLESEVLALQQNVDRSSLARLSASAQEANRLIDDRTFSWSALFALLEQAMPRDVRLIAVSPRFERGQRIVALTVAARGWADTDELIDALAKTGAFRNPAARETQGHDDGTYWSVVEGVYMPTAGAVVPATAASSDPPPSASGGRP